MEARRITPALIADDHADAADQWVRVERHIRGEVQNLGSTGKANFHVKLPDGSRLTVAADRALLRGAQKRCRKTAVLRIKADYNVLTRELRNATLIEFVLMSAPRSRGVV